MSYFIEPANATYFAVPKCACTSLKNFAFQVNEGRPYNGSEASKTGARIHRHIRSFKFKQNRADAPGGSWKFALVRHPVDRVISCYESKIIGRDRVLDKVPGALLVVLGLKRNPTLAEFIRDLGRYRLVSRSLHHHTDPLAVFLGPDPSYFDRVFGLHELDQLAAEINGRAGTSVRIPHSNRSDKKHAKVEPDAVTPAIIERILRRYRADLDQYGAFMKPSKFMAPTPVA